MILVRRGFWRNPPPPLPMVLARPKTISSILIESPGNSRSGSSGEVLSLASHTGGEARIANLETGLSSLQASLSNFSPILSSRSLGWDQDSSDLSTPGYASLRRRACFRGS